MSKKITRRQFIALALGAIGTGAVAVVGLDRLLNDDGTQTLTFDPTTGELDTVALATLMELVRTYVGAHGEIGHYRAYFTWRAANLPEYLSTYQAFAVALDHGAQELSGMAFRLSDNATRERILAYWLGIPLAESSLADPQVPEDIHIHDDNGEQLIELWLRFDRMVIGEMVNVFLNTNGWILLGYPAYPGQARGLESYQQPVTGSES